MKSNSASKKMNKFRTSPFMIGVAILEVIILICVSTYAWFAITERDTITTDFLGVEPDSGLEIDFNDASEDGAVDINRYITDFCFEPVTSLDGRNIFVPTTGTFNNTDTGNIAFREATVNDMNSKYINVDFTLTNTADEKMDVYLSSKSTFTYDLGDGNTSEGKALRIAFYQNDGNSGAVDNDLIDKEDSDTPGGTGNNSFYIFFKNNATKNKWNTILSENDHTKNKYNGGAPMEKVYNSKGEEFYCIEVSEYLNANKKLTFLKFTTNDANVHPNQTQQFGVYQGDNADELTEKYIKFNDYYYEFDLNTDGSPKTDSNNQHYLLKEPIKFNPGDEPKVSSDTTTSSKSTTTIYFQNTRNWETPYIHIWNPNDNNATPNGVSFPGVKMTHIAGDLYYHTFESKYSSVCFSDGLNTGETERSYNITSPKNQYLYYLTDTDKREKSNDGKFFINYYNYDSYPYVKSDDGDGYPVISPGVSAGFQRAYAPVLSIDNTSGKSTNIVPAFASSIDNYSFASGKQLFTIPSKQTLTMSMIIWLEGTDNDCTGGNYLGKNIDLNLIFATKDNADELYTYKFVDATKETWLANEAANESGVTFDPVIQLYDRVSGKGYLMELVKETIEDENGEKKEKQTWVCKAPKDLIQDGKLSFRRVNPLNESEVYNFWDTEKFVNTDGSLDKTEENDGVIGAVYFTAFADGTPTKTLKNKSDEYYTDMPDYSCGGLWGKHATQILTVFDGTNDQWIKKSEIEGTTSVLTVNYEYNDQTIEYKASADTTKGMYYFVLPTAICSTEGKTEFIFKRYFNFDAKYAINSDKNQLTYHMDFDANTYGGEFVQIAENVYNDPNKPSRWCYWGNDMLYIEALKYEGTNGSAGFDLHADGGQLRVNFFKDDYPPNDTEHYVTYLYQNSEFKGNSDSQLGYACVIPNQGPYGRYVVERFGVVENNSKKEIKVWNRTHTVDDDHKLACSGNGAPYTITTQYNICKLTQYEDGKDTNNIGYIKCEYYNDNKYD